MGTYTVVGPCAYAKDGRMVRLRQVGATVALDDATAAKLGAAVTPVDATPDEPAPEPATPAPAPTEQPEAAADAG